MKTWLSTCLAIVASSGLLVVFFGQQITIAADAPAGIVLTAPRQPDDGQDIPGSVVRLVAASPRNRAEEDVGQDEPDSTKPALAIKYGDGKADGKKSLGGTGEMIRFELPDKSQQVRGLRIHAARYGSPKAPDEDVEITFEDDKREEIVGTRSAPYAKFRRGTSRWVTVKFDEPVEVPAVFWVTVDFAAEQTKGVYVSYDTASGGKHSRSGVPGADAKPVAFDGDWMIQALLTKPSE